MSGMLPWWRDRWREFQHDPEVSGKSVSHYAGTPKDYKADRRVFNCYSSTATGKHSDVQTSESVFKDPKLRMVGVVILICFWFIGRWLVDFFTDEKPVPSPVAVPAPPLSDVAVHRPDTKNDNFAVIPVVTDNKPLEMDLPTIRKLSVHGFEETDLDRIPMTCRVNRRHVACKLPRSIDLMRVAINYQCDDFSCFVYFFPKPPSDDDKNNQHRLISSSTVLAQASVPFR
jgi:zona occludens toxin